jgi:AraC family transcriptional regulator
MAIKIVERPALTVVGMKIVTKPMSPEIPALWTRFVARIDEIENALEPRVSYGVMWSGASMEELHYIASISVTSAVRIPAGMTSHALAAGTYASFKYPLSGLQQGFREIFEKLMPASGYVQLNTAHLERYDEAFNPENSASLVEICLPVRAK